MLATSNALKLRCQYMFFPTFEMSDFHSTLNHDHSLQRQSSLMDHTLIDIPNTPQRFSPCFDDTVLIWHSSNVEYYRSMHPDNLKNRPLDFSDIGAIPAPV